MNPHLGVGVAVLTVGAGLLSGCGATSPSDQVRNTINDFATAAAENDYQHICSDLIAPDVLKEFKQHKLSCVAAFKSSLQNHKNAKFDIVKITVQGKVGVAQVHATSSNTQPVTDTFTLVKNRKGMWQIAGDVVKPG